MASKTLPTPSQTTTTSKPKPSLERLDSLLETYLDLLDQYTTLRTQLSKHFSDGFFTLARANHTSPSLGAGRRYGEEGYDERMKAGRRITYGLTGTRGSDAEVQREKGDSPSEHSENSASVEESADYGPGSSISISISTHQAIVDEEEQAVPAEDLSNDSGASQTKQQASEDTPSTPTPQPMTTQPKSTPTGSPPSSSKTKSKPKPKVIDPLHWFGILVPPPLRQSQTCFATAVSTCIPALLNTSSQMRDLEATIQSLRVELGLQNPSSTRGEDEKLGITAAHAASAPGAAVETKPNADLDREDALTPTSPRKRLVQRAAEPRSRIIKLDC